MNAIVNLRSVGGVLTSGEAPVITSGTISPERKVSGALKPIGMRACFSYAAALLQGVALLFVLLYLFGAVAFGVALMFDELVARSRARCSRFPLSLSLVHRLA